SKKITTRNQNNCVAHFIVIFPLFLWSGSKPTMSPRCACIYYLVIFVYQDPAFSCHLFIFFKTIFKVVVFKI
uniref:Uncharacterized protein n=1 Tax=Piliocolobus tephrosceles TaxID=591936 RepID=A0A8C9IVI4_9PRIM